MYPGLYTVCGMLRKMSCARPFAPSARSAGQSLRSNCVPEALSLGGAGGDRGSKYAVKGGDPPPASQLALLAACPRAAARRA